MTQPLTRDDLNAEAWKSFDVIVIDMGTYHWLTCPDRVAAYAMVTDLADAEGAMRAVMDGKCRGQSYVLNYVHA